jgi:type 1 glutamine amidotransferase
METTLRVLFVGGCPASYHRLEPAEPEVRRALAPLGATLTVAGIRHPDGVDGFVGDYTALTAESLSGYDVVVLFTTGHGHGEDTRALIEWVRRGGALLGIHCAADSFTDDSDYVALIGGKFRTHPAPLDVTVEFVDTDHPITRGLAPFTVRDELYLFNDYDPARVHLLAETRSYDGEGPASIPVCWTRTEGDGRVFYLSLGHFPDAMASLGWQTLFARGAAWAVGRL